VGLRYDEIADILKIIDSSSCDEVVIETGDLRLVVRRNGAGRAEHVSPTQTREVTRPVAPARANDAAPPLPTASTTRKTAPGHLEITAPMVGIFYRAPSPNDPPFVEVGSLVEIGQPLCLIEVMKLFTTISSEFAGRIVEINAENGALVEYGHTLFVIEPA
jgi:acetyl-CoA carboxylase biotin carboxyl carrier protein